MNSGKRRLLRLLLLALLPLTAAGCIHGPSAFRSSHALHNEALRARVDEELLLNLVRLRYRDSPLFLQVGSVVTQFEVSGELGTGGSLTEGGPGSLDIGASIGWSEQPTYTFTPMQDDEFVRRLLTPLDLELVVLLQRSGWSIGRVLRLTMQEFAGHDNATSASGPTPVRAPVFEDFLRVTEALRALQQQGGIHLAYEESVTEVSPPIESSAVRGADLVSAAQSDLRFRPAPGSDSQLVLTRAKKKPVLVLSPAANELAEQAELASMLDLPASVTRFELVVGAGGGDSAGVRDNGTIRVGTRSLLGVLFYLSHGIDVPESHAAEGLVTVTRDREGRPFDWLQLTGDLLRVKTSRTRPDAAAVAVPYRGQWFFVEDSDLESKSTLALLVELLNMSAGEEVGETPTLTLPLG